jgi:hypothetical protein
VQQQQDWKNHLISWRFSSAWHRIGNDCHKTLNRFWRHSDLIEVKDGRYESHGRGSTNSKAAGRGSKPTALPFPAAPSSSARQKGVVGYSNRRPSATSGLVHPPFG